MINSPTSLVLPHTLCTCGVCGATFPKKMKKTIGPASNWAFCMWIFSGFCKKSDKYCFPQVVLGIEFLDILIWKDVCKRFATQ